MTQKFAGYLPPNAFVMGRKQVPQKVAVAEEAEMPVAVARAATPSEGPVPALVGVGNPRAQLMFVGAGRGPLLDKMIQAMGLEPEQVYIAPVTDPVAVATHVLAVKPKVIVALGFNPAKNPVRGTFQPYEGAEMISTRHPDEMLKNPATKKEAWEDLKLVMKELGLKPKSAK